MPNALNALPPTEQFQSLLIDGIRHDLQDTQHIISFMTLSMESDNDYTENCSTQPPTWMQKRYVTYSVIVYISMASNIFNPHQIVNATIYNFKWCKTIIIMYNIEKLHIQCEFPSVHYSIPLERERSPPMGSENGNECSLKSRNYSKTNWHRKKTTANIKKKKKGKKSELKESSEKKHSTNFEATSTRKRTERWIANSRNEMWVTVYQIPYIRTHHPFRYHRLSSVQLE